MAGPNLPINRTTASTVAEHVADHNTAHNIVNKFDKDALPVAGESLVWNGTVYVPDIPIGGAIEDPADPGFFIAGDEDVAALGYVNVKDPAYGAIGDGIANDTAAINTAIAALVAGGTLYFPPGRYMTDGGHNISTPACRIMGPGGRERTFHSSAQLYLRNSANTDMLTISATTTVRDLTLYGNYPNQSGVSRGIVTPVTSSPTYTLLDAVWIDSFNGDGLSIESAGGSVSMTVVNSESRSNRGYGIYFGPTASDIIIDSCYIDQNTQSGIHCRSAALSVSNCHIWGNGTAGSGNRDGISLQTTNGLRVTNCYIESNANGAGIACRSGAHNGWIISGNDIWANGENGVYLHFADTGIFANNAVRHNNALTLTADNGAALKVESCEDVTIIGNNFFDIQTPRQTYAYYEMGAASEDVKFVGNAVNALHFTTGGVFLGPRTEADLGGFVRYKTADQSVTSSTTLVDDANLQWPVMAGEVWELQGVLFCDGAQAGDLGVRLTAPSGMTGYWRSLGPNASATATSATNMLPVGQLFNTTQGVGLLGAGIIVPITISGLLIVGTTGTFKLQFAQSTSDATATILKAGSYLRGRRVAQ